MRVQREELIKECRSALHHREGSALEQIPAEGAHSCMTFINVKYNRGLKLCKLCLKTWQIGPSDVKGICKCGGKCTFHSLWI